MEQSASPIAIIRFTEDRSAVWHVDVAPASPSARLCGAWVTDDVSTLSTVLAARPLLPFGGKLTRQTISRVSGDTQMVVDPIATLSSIDATMAALENRHRESRTASGAARAPISWPALPQELDWATLPAPRRGVNPDPFIAETIAVARWLADLADAWSAIEVARSSRPHLSGSEAAPHPFPTAFVHVAVRDARPVE